MINIYTILIHSGHFSEINIWRRISKFPSLVCISVSPLFHSLFLFSPPWAFSRLTVHILQDIQKNIICHIMAKVYVIWLVSICRILPNLQKVSMTVGRDIPITRILIFYSNKVIYKVPRFIRQICFELSGWRGPGSSPQELTIFQSR